MARPSDISTKVVSFRIPMKDYIKLLSQATDKGLSISDYMLMRVYKSDGELDSLKEPAKAQTPASTEEAIKRPSKPRSKKNATKTTSKAVKEPQKEPEKPVEPKPKAKPIQATKKPPKPAKKREMSVKQKEALAKGREKAKQERIAKAQEEAKSMIEKRREKEIDTLKDELEYCQMQIQKAKGTDEAKLDELYEEEIELHGKLADLYQQRKG